MITHLLGGFSIRIYISVRDGVAVLCCNYHPDWLPHVMGDELSTVREKIKYHLERQHGLTMNPEGEIVKIVYPKPEVEA